MRRMIGVGALALVACGTGSPTEDAEVSEANIGVQDDTRAERVLVARNLADPAVFKVDDDAYLLTGTGSTIDLPFWASSDLATWAPRAPYNPSRVDPLHDYCALWAPDIVRTGGKVRVYFSAYRVAKGAACPAPGAEVTTYFAEATSAQEPVFGAPQPLFEGTTGARTFSPKACPAEGCDRAIRIDAAHYEDADNPAHLFYVYFDRGNNIASVPLGQPASVERHTGLGAFPSEAQPYEEGINEAPYVVRRGALYYLFFSSGDFRSQYALQYLVGESLADLTRDRAVHRATAPVRGNDGKLIETHGHNSVTTHRGEAYDFFHVGVFDGGGNLVGRDTYRQRMVFRSDGTVVSHNVAKLRWTPVPGESYSLDLVLRDGSIVGPCIDAARLGTTSEVAFAGVCPSAGDRLVHKSAIAAFRLYHSATGAFSSHVDVPYNGIDEDVFAPIAGGTPAHLGLRWNERATGTRYSLDVKDAAGRWTGPCVGADVVGKGVTYEYDGACPAAGSRVEVAQARAFRLCAAQNDDWAHAHCVESPVDASRGDVTLTLP